MENATITKLSGVDTYHEDHSKYQLVTYHNANIVVWDDDSIKLNTGGWFTATTKKRMNQVSREYSLGFHVYQKAHKWYVEYRGQVVSYGNGEFSSSIHYLERG